ncbi:MAG: hypothetical protein KDI71_17670 [Xanthomonadales bacterium]|nr:hypothetical protein [Xanthomonadales bacterium]
MRSNNALSSTRFTLSGLACALALSCGASAADAGPDAGWSIFLSSPTSQSLRMLPVGQTHAVADELGGVRLLLLDGHGPNPNTLTTQALAADGSLDGAPVGLAWDYRYGSEAALDARGDHYTLRHDTVSGTMVQTWLASDPQARTTLAFALSDAETVMVLRQAQNGDTLLVRRAIKSDRQSQLLVERYAIGGKRSWVRSLSAAPSGAVALSESDQGMIALSYIAKGGSFSREGATGSNLVNLVLDRDGNPEAENSVALDRDFQASAAIIAANGDTYIAAKSPGRRNARCAILAMANGAGQVNQPFNIDAVDCTAPERFAADNNGFSAIFDAELGDSVDTLMVSGDLQRKHWTRVIDSPQLGTARQLARLTDGSVVSAEAMPNLDAPTGSIDLIVQSYDRAGAISGLNRHLDLRHPQEFTIQSTADGGYVVAYSSYDPTIAKAAVAVTKVNDNAGGERQIGK